ncbi:MAG: hypothetical protein R2939_16220 [Kofleriaceae bacterium]
MRSSAASARGALVMTLVLGGCLTAAETPCGDGVCPAGTACLEPREDRPARCVAQPLVDACVGVADGDACDRGGITGTCRDAVCTAVACGDGVLDDGELCDDGNTVSGDGCRADCQGLERCGDGFLDVSERCDCGDDPLALPPGCLTVNDDAPTALCDQACSRYCGDGVISGGEQCDGAALASATCLELGYYGGELACSPQCSFDLGSCAGTCGDDVVQPLEEDCDGAPPTEICLDFGLDQGHLGCTARCTADLAGDCERLGWTPFLSGLAVWTDGELTALAGSTATILLPDGTRLDLPATGASHVTGHDGVVWFVGESKTVRWEDGVTTEVAMPTFSGFDLDISEVMVDASGQPWMVTLQPCGLWRLDPDGWVPQLETGTFCFGAGATDGARLVIAGESGGLSEWNGTAFVPLPQPGTVADLEFVDGQLAVASSTGLYLDGQQLQRGSFLGVDGAGGRLFGLRSDGEIRRWDGDTWLGVEGPPILGGRHLVVGADGSMLSVTRTQLYPSLQLRRGAWSSERDVAQALATPSTVARTVDGALVAGTTIGVLTADGWELASPAVASSDVWGASIRRFWAIVAGEVHAFDAANLGASSVVAGPWPATGALRLSGSDDGVLAVLATDGLYTAQSPGWLHAPTPAGCAFVDLAGGVAPAVYVIGACGVDAVLWQHDGTQLVERYRGPGQTLAALTLTGDGGVTAVGALTVRVELAGGPAITSAGSGVAIAGTVATDLWALRANTPATGLTQPMHWDGATWAPVRAPVDAAWRALAVGPDDVAMIRTGELARLLRVGPR